MLPPSPPLVAVTTLLVADALDRTPLGRATIRAWEERPFLRAVPATRRPTAFFSLGLTMGPKRDRVAGPGEAPAGGPPAAAVTDDPLPAAAPAGDPLPAPTDAELMARVASGDRDAFAAVYDRHAGAVYGAVLRYTRDAGTAEDVVQETYLALWRRPDTYAAGAGSLAGWLLAIARHRAIDRLRAASRRPQLLERDAAPGDGSDDQLDRLLAQGRPVAFAMMDDEPPDLAERGWVRAVVRTALESMAEPERQVLELAYDDGLSQTEIAERLGWPLGTVKTRTRRGLLRLRAMLEQVPDVGPEPARSAPVSAVGPTPAIDWGDPDGVRHGPR